MAKLFDADGAEVEAFTSDEVNAKVTQAVTAKEQEFTPKITELSEKLTDAEKRANERNGQFSNFRKLTEDAVAKLSVAERTIYENQLLMQEDKEKIAMLEKEKHTTLVDSALRAKAGTDEKLFTKMKEIWSIIGIEAVTTEEIENKVKMVLGAIGTTQPDLLATVQGFPGGSYTPPVITPKGDPSFADSDEGKKGAEELGLILETPKK